MALYYKFLGPKGEAIHGSGKWDLPTKGHPGKWMPKIPNPEPCRRGYHVCEEKDLLEWLRPDCWLAEVRGPEIKSDNKSVFQEGRLLMKTALDRTALRLFAADCAERALKFIKDDKHRKAISDVITVVRAFAFGLATADELQTAQNNAYDVRRKIFAADAYAAYDAANAANDAAYAAYDAADAYAAYAAYDAANAADAYAAYAAYDAANAANADANAANAAANAAYAANADARSKARAEEKAWQINRLIAYIHGRVDREALKSITEKELNKLKGK